MNCQIFTALVAYWLIAGGCSGPSGDVFSKKIIPFQHKQNIALLRAYAARSRIVVKTRKMEEGFCFLLDMSQPAGANRFIIYNLKKDVIESEGKVAHGRCNEYWLNGRRYSNTPGSGCTSLGKYSIGKSYKGRFGLAYKLYGLDSSNSNAFQRTVVLHAHSCVPDSEQAALWICQSDGCPMVSPAYLQALRKKLDNATRPVLLWIFDEVNVKK